MSDDHGASGDENNESSVFLSYAGADRQVAAQIVQHLRAFGLTIWWDGFHWGDNWIEKLQETLSACSAYIILIGARGIRPWMTTEIYMTIQHHVEEGVPVFPMLLDGVNLDSLPPFLRSPQARRLPKDLRQSDFRELAERLRMIGGASPDARVLIGDAVCPFPGLEAFHENDAPFFFGRQVETLAALRCLGHEPEGPCNRWLQIEGPSGVGKSSLVRAGLVPAIKRGWLEEGGEGRRWRVAPPMRPGTDPIESLAGSLSKSLGSEAHPLALSSLDGELRGDGDDALRHLLRRHMYEGERLLLVIDQLEEVFTLTQSAEDRGRFDALVAEALDDLDGPLHLISTIRSDFLLRFADLARLQDLLNKSSRRYVLPPIGELGLRDVVRTPARLAGLRWSDASLPDQIVQEAIGEPGALSLVGNLLRLLWDKRNDRTLNARVYHELGGLSGALASQADALLGSLGPDGKDRARKLLLALVEPGWGGSQDFRRTIARAEALKAAGGGQQAEIVLDALSGSRSAKATPRLVLVSPSKDGREVNAHTFVDLAHEVLLGDDRRGEPYWGTLRIWVNECRRALVDRQLLELLAEKWREGGKSWRSKQLARGRQLKEFRQAEAKVSELAASYLRASQRLRWWRFGAIGAIIALVAFIGFALVGR